MPDAKVYIVGIGDDGLLGLTEAARARVQQAEILVGPQKALELVPLEATQAEREPIETDLGRLVSTIQQNQDRRIVLLTSGDPLFYGTARYLCDRLGKELFEVVPHVSSMQLAFARIKESWEEAYLTNVANHPLEETLERIRTAEKVGLFTSEDCSPATIAKALLAEGISYFRAYVCENLGTRNEVVTTGSLAEVSEMTFGPLNVTILIREPGVPDTPRRSLAPRTFGNPDEAFLQSRPKRGLHTPAEVRTLAIAELGILPGSTLWDVGAGSGSVSIEAARLARDGVVYAIEPDAEDCDLIRRNADFFETPHVKVVTARAPDAFANLPDPDGVFIGGLGRETIRAVAEAFRRLRPGGRLVLNVASLENVSAATDILKPLAGSLNLLMINLARGTHQLETIRFESMNPSFLVSATKSQPGGA